MGKFRRHDELKLQRKGEVAAACHVKRKEYYQTR